MKVTVNETQSNEVDWSKNPQLVVSDGFVILVHENQDSESDRFTGTRIDFNGLSTFSTRWYKSEFKPFHGSITLSND